MLPNIRVMIVALLASIIGIGCGLSALAAFRVNHQPFTRMQSGNPPLQLAFVDGAPGTETDGMPAPFGVRFQVVAPLAPRATISPPAIQSPPPAAVTADSDRDANPPAEQQSAADTALGSAERSTLAAQEPTPAALEPKLAVQEPTRAVQESPAPAEDSKLVVVPPADATSAQAAEKTAAISPETTISADPKPNAKPTAAVTVKPAPKNARRRIVRIRRSPRSAPAGIAAPYANQNFTALPAYQPVPQGSAQENPALSGPRAASKQHGVVKRRRSPKKAATQQTAAGASVVATTRR